MYIHTIGLPFLWLRTRLKMPITPRVIQFVQNTKPGPQLCNIQSKLCIANTPNLLPELFFIVQALILILVVQKQLFMMLFKHWFVLRSLILIHQFFLGQNFYDTNIAKILNFTQKLNTCLRFLVSNPELYIETEYLPQILSFES